MPNDIVESSDVSTDGATDPASQRLVEVALLRRIQEAAEKVREADVELDEAMIEAKRAGLSWTAIGQMVGISRQAARQRILKRPDFGLGS